MRGLGNTHRIRAHFTADPPHSYRAIAIAILLLRYRGLGNTHRLWAHVTVNPPHSYSDDANDAIAIV